MLEYASRTLDASSTSTWRGHRRSHHPSALPRLRGAPNPPLEHLQIIYQVRQDLKAHMLVLSDPAQYEKLCSDPKERLRWSECAMALLLRLDSVQGAHADVRDIRKTVTKEVIAFQEIVDSTSNDASSGKQIVKSRGRATPFQSLFFALQQHGWIFISAKHLYSHR